MQSAHPRIVRRLEDIEMARHISHGNVDSRPYRVRLDGITLSFPEQVQTWWTLHGGAVEDIQSQVDHVILDVPARFDPEQVDAWLLTDGPEAMYQAVLPATPQRAVPLLIRGKAFEAENIRRSWASGTNTKLSALPRELARAVPHR